MKVSILIPVFNEVATVKKILDDVVNISLAPLEKEIIVIESNSTDGTKEIVKKYENNSLFKIIYEKRPQGKGHALKQGFIHASGDIILIQDADLEYKVAEYPELLEPILKNKTDFVLGSRHINKKTWKIRSFIDSKWYAKILNFGGLFYTNCFNFLYGVKLTDPATMFKVFKRKCISDMVFKSNYFELDWEIVAKLIKKGYKPIEIPVSYNSRSTAEGKKIQFLRDGFLVLLAIIRFKFLD